MKQVAAFFDIDGTIYREGLITEVFKKMVTHELIPQSAWYDEVEPAFKAWDKRQGEYDEYLTKMVEIFKKHMKGMNKEHIEFIAQLVIEQKGERVYSYSRKRIEWHKKQGHKIIAISGSPEPLVRRMAQKYGFDDWRGTEYCLSDEGVYTGEIIPMWDSDSKKKAMNELKEEYDLDLSESYSYGDTNGDLTMFLQTGHPTAINPTKELLHQILKHDDLLERIRIIVERKDVIYHIHAKDLELE